MSLPKKSDKYGVIHCNVESYEETHPSKDRTNRFEVDNLIRKKGYKLVIRRLRTEAIWEKEGVRYLQREIECRLDQAELWNAEYLESLYWQGYPE